MKRAMFSPEVINMNQSALKCSLTSINLQLKKQFLLLNVVSHVLLLLLWQVEGKQFERWFIATEP